MLSPMERPLLLLESSSLFAQLFIVTAADAILTLSFEDLLEELAPLWNLFHDLARDKV